jgi:hypothetical protein
VGWRWRWCRGGGDDDLEGGKAEHRAAFVAGSEAWDVGDDDELPSAVVCSVGPT